MRCATLHLSLPAFVLGASLSVSGCFVSIDESLLNEQQPGEDAAVDVPVVLPDAAEGGETSLPDAAPDTDAAVPDVVSPDAADADAAPLDAPAEADAPQEASPDATDAPEVLDAAEDQDEAEASTEDADEDASDAEDDVVEAGDEPGLDAPEDVTPDVQKPDAGLVVCSNDSDCAPVACKWRKCVAGQCIDQGPLGETVGFFNLTGGEQPVCSHQYDSSCIVAVGSYVVALTANGLQVFNVNNPMSITQQPVQTSAVAGATMMARSGQRVWTAADAGNGIVTISWLDLPSSGTSPVPPLHQSNVYLGTAPSKLFPYPNDTLLVHAPAGSYPGFARFGPGLPTWLDLFPATDSAEPTPVAASASRVLMHGVSGSGPFQHSFSLQTNAAYASSSNTGATDILSLSSATPSSGFFATSRKGAVAWLIGSNDGTSWNDVRAFWLADPALPTVSAANEYLVENFTAQQVSPPVGPAAFIDETTVAAAVVSAFTQTIALDIISRTEAKVTKRIPMPSLPLSGLSVAGDKGYAFVSRDNEVHVFAPACNPN
jgi:hypothetical protein